MHDIDRTQVQKGGEYEAGDFETADAMGELDPEFELELDGILREAGAGQDELEAQDEMEVQEIDLASELMGAGSDQELDQFIGRAFRRLRRRVLPGALARALGGLLKGVAKRSLPGIGGALGTLAIPGVGSMAGAQVGRMAGNLFEVPENEFGEGEYEFEVARRFVRLTDDALAQAERMPADADPRAVAREALRRAATRHAPGLAQALAQAGRTTGRPGGNGRGDGVSNGNSRRPDGQSGRWVRRGDAIVLFGAG